MRASATFLMSALLVGALAGCGQDAPAAPVAEETAVPEGLQTADVLPDAEEAAPQIGTPMAERVATIGVLNKRNNVSQDLEMKPGEARRLGDVIIRLSACERTPPWEMPRETGAFVQVLTVIKDQDEDTEDQWKRVFSGWLFKNSPSLNVVEDPVYDVWVKECVMSFPGEAEPPASSAPEPAAPTPETNET